MKLLALQNRPRDPFDSWLQENRPDLRVAESDVVPLDGKVGWTPGDEAGPGGSGCSKCGGRIQVGSRLYCPKCTASGHEHRLAEQRAIQPPPPRSRARRPAFQRLSRKARRAG